MGFSNISQAATIKGKLISLEETVKQITEEINHYKKEVENLRKEKNNMENSLETKAYEASKDLTNELNRSLDDMKNNFQIQKSENLKLQHQVVQLKTEKTALQQQVLAIQRRIAELEMQVGSDEHHH